MRLTQSMLRPIHGNGKSFARRAARHQRETVQRMAYKDADAVYPGVKKGHKKYAEKLDFMENRIVKYLAPNEKKVAAARKKLIKHLEAASERGRAAL